jgi:hypothetical protein
MWKFKDIQIKSKEDIPIEFENSIGFIYIITQLSTGRRYIGRKLLTKASTKTVKGVKKKIRKDSDWIDYWSSSPKIKAWIDESGTDDFTKEILIFVSSKGSMAYCEELALYTMGVLESDLWLNDNIRSKIYRSWAKPEEAKVLREILGRL